MSKCNNASAWMLWNLFGSMLKFRGANCIYEKQTNIARKLSVARPNVSRAAKILIKIEAIKKIKNGYMLNPEAIFVGSEDERKTAVGMWRSK